MSMDREPFMPFPALNCSDCSPQVRSDLLPGIETILGIWPWKKGDARAVERVEPAYPALARQTRIQGTVRLHAIIGTDGHVEELEVISGHPLLVQAAMEAARKWRYAPTTWNGQPVEVDTTIDVIFFLEEKGRSASSGSA